MSISTFRDVVAIWGPEDLATEIGASVAAARKWSQRNAIPAEWWAPLLRTKRARAAGVTAELLAELAARETRQ